MKTIQADLSKGNDEIRKKQSTIKNQIIDNETNWEREVKHQNTYKKEI